MTPSDPVLPSTEGTLKNFKAGLPIKLARELTAPTTTVQKKTGVLPLTKEALQSFDQLRANSVRKISHPGLPLPAERFTASPEKVSSD